MFQIFGTYRKGASTNILCRIFRLYNEYVSSWILFNSGMHIIKNVETIDTLSQILLIL